MFKIGVRIGHTSVADQIIAYEMQFGRHYGWDLFQISGN